MQSPLQAPPPRRVVALLFGLGSLCAYAPSVSAQGWIVGGGIGTSGQEEIIVSGPVDAFSFDDEDTAYRLFGAYMATPTQGVVASFVDLGATAFESTAPSLFTDEIETTGIDLSYRIGWAPGRQERASIFGTVGVFSWDNELVRTDGAGTVDFSDDGTSFSLGAGAEIHLGGNLSSGWSIQLNYQLYKDVGDPASSGQESDREIFTAGVSYRFGPGRL